MKETQREFNEYGIVFKYSSEYRSVLSDHPGDYATQIDGTIYDALQEEGNPVKIGDFILFTINPFEFGDLNVAPYFDILDAHSEILSGYFPVLFDGVHNFEFTDRVENIAFTGGARRFAIIEVLHIQPEYRGRNLGLLMMSRLIQHFASDAALVVIKPHPLQYSLRDEDDPRPSPYGNMSREDATQKLADYWSKMNFRPVPEHWPFMVLSPNTKQQPLEDWLHE
ncbi:MAG: GNAT family N-acetyltransferase [Chloroflexi bacterium]|nr:GNAT family N-acetyltransferase [Chloroflexota bacterium]